MRVRLVSWILVALMAHATFLPPPARALDDDEVPAWVPWTLVASAVVGGLLYVFRRDRLPDPSGLPPYERARDLILDIATKDELLELAVLEDDAQIEPFLRAFFARRDPTPGTEDNEFEIEHLERYQEAFAMYGRSRQSWRSDRRRVYIVHGAPAAVHRFEVREPIDYNRDWKSAEIWEYDARPGTNPLPAILENPRLFDLIFRDVPPITGSKLFLFINDSGEGFSRLAFTTEEGEPFDASIYAIGAQLR